MTSSTSKTLHHYVPSTSRSRSPSTPTPTPISTSTSIPSHPPSDHDVQKIHYAHDSPSQYILIYPSTATSTSTSTSTSKSTSTTNCHPDSDSLRLVIFVHGGFWKQQYGLDPPSSSACDTIIPAFRSSSTIDRTILIEYRRLHSDSARPQQQQQQQQAATGYPHTNQDVLSAYTYIHKLFDDKRLHVVLLGHSAGGTLILWLLAQLHQPAHQRLCKPLLCMPLAPVSNLRMAAALRLSDSGDAVQNYMRGSASPSESESESESELQYAQACPTMLAHTLARALVHTSITFVIGDDDVDIPLPVVSSCHDAIVGCIDGNKTQSQVGKQLQLVTLPRTDHYSVVNAESHAWLTIMDCIQSVLSCGGSIKPENE